MPCSVSPIICGHQFRRCTLRQGYKRPLQLEDVFDLAPPDRAEEVAKEFDRRWDKQLQKKATGGKPSLVRDALCQQRALHVLCLHDMLVLMNSQQA